MDRRDWSAMAATASHDICADFGTGEISGRDAVIALSRSCLDNCGTTQHLSGNVIIDVAGDQATSESCVSDMHLGKDPVQVPGVG